MVKKSKPRAIIHLAAIVPIKEVNKNKLEAYKTNFLGTKNLVDACLKNNIKWFFLLLRMFIVHQKKISETTRIYPCSYYGKRKFLQKTTKKKIKK